MLLVVCALGESRVVESAGDLVDEDGAEVDGAEAVFVANSND